MSVKIQTSPDLVVGRPVQLFDPSPYFRGSAAGTVYDVTADDQRFLFARSPESTGSDGHDRPSTVLVNNFTKVLRQMVGR